MAGDVSLLFDVAGGGTLSGDSGAEIQKQLNSIVSEINKSPFKIKFQADEESLNKMREAVQKITESLRSVSLDISANTGKSSGGIVNEISKTTAKINSTKIIGTNIKDAQKDVDGLIRRFEALRSASAGSTAVIRSVSELTPMKDAQSVIDELIKKLRIYNGEINEILVNQEEINPDVLNFDTLSPDTTIESFRQTMETYKSAYSSVKDEITENERLRARLSKADKENLKDSNALSKAIVATNRAYKQATEALQKYTAAKNGKSSKQYTEIEQQAAALKNLEERLHSGAISEREYVKATNEARAKIQEATAIIKANGEAHLSLADKIKVTAEKFTQYFGIAKIVNLAWRATQKMVQATIELDDAFTQLKIVTGATDSEMEKFSDTAIKLSKSLGQSVADVTKSIETFSRLGYNLPDASALAEYATILANTAAVSTDEATTGLTSIIKGFQLDVEDAEHVSDVLIQVGQKYAVSAGELMEAFERSGAALNATNVSFEKAAGLIAAANASVQDSSTIGTALKTVSARIRGSKSDLEELGEDTTDLAEGFSKYAKELQALTGFNIMVEGSTTEFKDLFDIMQGISEVWDDLSGTSRARVSEILGGKHMCRAA